MSPVTRLAVSPATRLTETCFREFPAKRVSRLLLPNSVYCYDCKHVWPRSHSGSVDAYTELGNNSLEPRFAGNSRNQVSVTRVTGDTANRVTGDVVTFLGASRLAKQGAGE